MAIGKLNSSGGGGTGTGVFEPVEDITALKALDTSNATNWKDKWTIIVEGEGNWYRFDRESVVAESLPKIISPTTGIGRWLQITGLVPEAPQDSQDYVRKDGAWALPAAPTVLLQERIPFNMDLDTVSPPVLMKGGLVSMEMNAESKINANATVIQVRLDSTDTWTAITTGATLTDTVANLLIWVAANVSSGVEWEFEVIITPNTSETGETSILAIYQSDT